MRAFVRRHPNAGYGGMFLQWAFTDEAPAYGSWGNGAPMRVAAIGWLAMDENEADALASRQAEVSHNHPDALKASQAVARTILALRRGVPVPDVRAWVGETYRYDLRLEVALRGGGFDISAAGTIPPAMAVHPASPGAPRSGQDAPQPGHARRAPGGTGHRISDRAGLIRHPVSRD